MKQFLNLGFRCAIACLFIWLAFVKKIEGKDPSMEISETTGTLVKTSCGQNRVNFYSFNRVGDKGATSHRASIPTSRTPTKTTQRSRTTTTRRPTRNTTTSTSNPFPSTTTIRFSANTTTQFLSTTTIQFPTITTTKFATTTTSRRPSSLIPENIQVSLDCGGRIPMYVTGDSKLLAYTANKTYSNNERCLWTLDNESNSIRNMQTLRIKLIRHGFEKEYDWLYALKFNRATGLVSQKIELEQEYTFSEDQLYLSFTSDESITGTGFVIQLNVIDTVESGGRGWTLYNSSTPGMAVGGGYGENDLFNIVINPKTNITFEVNYVHVEKSDSSCDYDRLMVWEIGYGGNVTEKARLCGDISSTSSSFTTTDPVLAVFTADGSSTGSGPISAGFKFSWG